MRQKNSSWLRNRKRKMIHYLRLFNYLVHVIQLLSHFAINPSCKPYLTQWGSNELIMEGDNNVGNVARRPKKQSISQLIISEMQTTDKKPPNVFGGTLPACAL